MPRIFFGNFDFEHELAASARAHPAPQVSRSTVPAGNVAARLLQCPAHVDHEIQAALATAWIAIAEEGDLVLKSQPVVPLAFSELDEMGWPLPRFITTPDELNGIVETSFVPWGWTPSMAALAAERGWSCSIPPLEVVRQINSRRYRFELETAFDVALPGAAAVTSIESLQEQVAKAGSAPLGWIVKSNFGMAGRESVRGRGAILSEGLQNWARKRIVQGGCVVFEPLVAPLAEAGVQMEIPRGGIPQLIGVTPLLVDRTGTYRGSRFGKFESDVALWQPAIDVALRVAAHVQQLGYFGPLGIDAMWYQTDEGERRLRPLQDLNARFTMGRLALGFERIVPPGWCASWLHASRRGAAHLSTPRADLVSRRVGRAKIVSTSHDAADAHRSVLVMAESAEVRAELETDCFSA